MTQFYSRNDVNYNGDVYSIPFPYMKEEEIHVYLDDALFTDWFFLNDSQIKLRNIPQEVTSNTIVSVRRVTDIDKKVVTYTNNTLLNKENLNLSQDQLLYAVQEIYDNNTQFAIDIRAEVDEKVERVSDAVEQLEALNDAVETAVNASAVAGEKAEIVTQKEEEINQTIHQATQEINQQAALEKAEIDSLSNDLKESIKDLKVLTTLEIGDIGIAPLGIDETKGKRRYLNGQLIIQEQYVQFTNKVKSAVALYPSLACTESEWQTTATMTVGGQVGKFVVDDDAGTIRLPKIIMPIQGLTNLSKLAEIVEAGLPNIQGSIGSMLHYGDNDENGALRVHDRGNSLTFPAGSGGWGGSIITLNASKSNPIYGNSTTVQQEQIQYPYFIQVATGAETEDNIINEIELNNPFSLLDYKYSEYELNNLSWLRSNGQYNSKAVYPAVYDLLLKIYNGTETKAGVSVKLTTETFTDYDFVLNTAEEIFRLPIKVKLASGKAVVGNGKTLGWSDGTTEYGSYSGAAGSAVGFVVSGSVAADLEIGNSVPTGSYSGAPARAILGVTTDPTKSGLELSDSNLYLYFYVGETVQNANLVNIGRIQEQYTTKSMVDGQWIPTSTSEVMDGTALLANVSLEANTPVICDLTPYLPNDGYNYEILLNATGETGNVSGNGARVYVKSGTNNYFHLSFDTTTTRTSSLVGWGGSVMIPIFANEKSITLTQVHNSTCKLGRLSLAGYRRIGTNL